MNILKMLVFGLIKHAAAYFIFVDYEKALDTIDQHKILLALAES